MAWTGRSILNTGCRLVSSSFRDEDGSLKMITHNTLTLLVGEDVVIVTSASSSARASSLHTENQHEKQSTVNQPCLPSNALTSSEDVQQFIHCPLGLSEQTLLGCCWHVDETWAPTYLGFILWSSFNFVCLRVHQSRYKDSWLKLQSPPPLETFRFWWAKKIYNRV